MTASEQTGNVLTMPVSPRSVMLPSPRSRGLGLRSHIFSRPPLGSLTLRPGDSLAIPKMASSVGFIRFVSSPDATQATKVLTLPPVGLTPTEHASLIWTHSCAINHAADSACSRSSFETIRVMKAAENRRGDDAVAGANAMAERHRRKVGRIRNTGSE